MTKKLTIRELGLSLGFKDVPEDDPIYTMGWIASANPSSIVPESQFDRRDLSQGSLSATSEEDSEAPDTENE
jgi:hypothetical protein